MNIIERLNTLPKELQDKIIINALTATPTAKLINELKTKNNLIKKFKLTIKVKPCIKIFDSYFVNKNSHNDEHMYILDMLIENYIKYENIIHIHPVIDINPDIDPHYSFHIPELIGLYIYHKNGYNMYMDVWRFRTSYTCYGHELISWDKI